MKAMNEFGTVLVIAALIVGACIATTTLPLAPDAGSASQSGIYPSYGMRVAAAVLQRY